MRPEATAGPMERSFRPLKVGEENGSSVCAHNAVARRVRPARKRMGGALPLSSSRLGVVEIGVVLEIYEAVPLVLVPQPRQFLHDLLVHSRPRGGRVGRRFE